MVGAFLAAHDPPGKVIRRLRGKVPVIAVTRGSEPIVISSKGGSLGGKSLSTRDLSLFVDDVVIGPGAQASVQVAVAANGDGLAPNPVPDRRRATSPRLIAAGCRST